MATVSISLWMEQGSLNLPVGNIPFWGFAPFKGGIPTLPGPLIEAEVGDTVNISLHNQTIPVPVSLIFPGQEDVMTRKSSGNWRRVSPQYSCGTMISLTDFLEPGATGYIQYRFRAVKPGIYLYESGTNPEYQVQMGLYGAIVVRPGGHNRKTDRDYQTAYGAETGTKYDVEKILVLGELDSELHTALAQGSDYNMLNYKPDYWLINGRCCPDTVKSNCYPNMPNQPFGSLIQARAGERVLLRLLNAGFQNHTLHLGGLTGRVVAADGFPLISAEADASYQKASVTLASGQSMDIIIIPEYPGSYYLYARELNHIVNNDSFPGGMMTKMVVTA